ncbi:DUF551 domain-containing protein [Zavarzinella formosa]|uniref:DUF551 domain-containing protein n=1 Tax=Zavarzinella formosa TaxID=360055 RepID=UPI0012F8D0D1|nr:DUF551 domain-containing protein [Zavarzinella formosa]
MDFAEEKYLSVFTQFDWKMWQAAWNTRTSPPSSINQSWWRAIESAPKDGAWVLLTGFSPQLATGERWHATGSYEHGKWSNGYVYLHPPTHWMPLPPPPSEQHGGEVTDGEPILCNECKGNGWVICVGSDAKGNPVEEQNQCYVCRSTGYQLVLAPQLNEVLDEEAARVISQGWHTGQAPSASAVASLKAAGLRVVRV